MASSPASEATAHLVYQLPQLNKIENVFNKVWRMKKLYYFCVPLLKRRIYKLKTKRSDTRHIMAKHPVRRDPPHIWSSSFIAEEKLKLISIKFGDKIISTTFASRFEKDGKSETDKRPKLVSDFGNKTLTANMTNIRFRKKPDRHQSSLKYR